ncbi:MAG: GntR family transcriptional regulator [Lachnospiraceae bacterium]|nr:GntR family transcriptional regulator [Lachnospiraceae bacterium]
MEQIKKIKPRDYAIEQIQWYIKENKLGSHAKLPGERDMCAMWDLNRSTLRSAIKRLIEEGILYSAVGSGTYVAPPKFRMNLQDAKSTTESLRGTGNFLWTETVWSQLRDADALLAEKLGIPQGEKVFHLIRLRRKNNIPFRIEESFLNHSLCQGIEKHNFTDESLYKILKKNGIFPEKGSEEIGIAYVTGQEAKWLEIEENQAVFRLEGVTRDDEERIIEYFRILARADQVQFSSVLTVEFEKNGGVQ